MGSIGPTYSVLLNSAYYFLNYVLIIHSEKGYRLLVINNRLVLWDKNYETLRGARIAFAKYFKYKAVAFLKNNLWSPEFELDKKWFRDIQAGIKGPPATQVHSNA